MDRIDPGQVAKWLLLAFAGSTLCFLTWMIWEKEGAPLPGLLFCVFVTCWLCAPTAIATVMVAGSDFRWTSWSYLVAQVVVVATAVWLIVPLFLMPDAQNGIALMFFPILQGAGLLSYWIVISVIRLGLQLGRSEPS